ncbi:PREDICTED: INO80 complex subunit B-like [Populus euphratica]|uniref:INO80 complex subunit B-like n=1 Tax=Populus euphratica TaxID=75702 RepID=A0AAJ6TTG3_POPEU|nr:PREDICTED: INO80 complex subunit B-like [Populus euphratica]
MEELGLAQFDAMGSAVRKKRSQISRRPKDSQTFTDNCDRSSLSISPPSDDMSKASSDENADNCRRKEFGLNQSVSRVSSATTRAERKRALSDSHSRRSVINNKTSREGALAPVNWRSKSKLKECKDVESRTANMYCGRNGESWSSEQSGVSFDVLGNESKFKKVKFKVGDVTHTINANSTTNGVPSTKNPRFSDTSSTRQKLSLQGNLEEERFVSGKRPGLQGVPWKEFSRVGFSLGKEDCLMGKTSGKNTAGKQGNKSERKNKRATKRHVLDGEFGEDDDDDEIRYLEKLKLKVPSRHKEVPSRHKEDDGNDDDESSKKQRKLSTLGSIGASRLVKDGKKISRSDQAPEDEDYEEEEPLSDGEFVGSKKKQKKEYVESLTHGKRELTLTKRQRALQSSKDGSSVPDANLIEFPNGLPPAPSKKQKEKLTEVEQQSKKAEAAQRRRLQVEKAARESEAEAIRKILGQDSSRKKREEKMKKRLEELAQEKATNAQMHASSTVRWVMGPTGTVVTFPKEMGLPSIFDSKPCSYPPPREKCAGPSCTNPYKYRDSKSKLPLCSLQCYKAIQQQRQHETN